MNRDIITIDVSNKPYKKVDGYLRNLKINPERIAISIHENNSKYCPINWGNILPYDHRIKKIILLKMDNLYLYIGSTIDGKKIVYSEAFSEFLLSNSISLVDKQIKTDVIPAKVNFVPKNNAEKVNVYLRVNVYLEKIKNGGIESLTFEERKNLDKLSKIIK
jgi:hypothetical protein